MAADGSTSAETTADPEPLYRLRSADALLRTHEELAKQEIHFGLPEKLNDPMEGFTDVLWKGDEILWANLIRHYLLCLSWYASYWLISSIDGYEPGPIWGSLTESDLPTDNYKRLYADVCAEFDRSLNINETSKHLASLRSPVRREGLRSILSLVHPVAVDRLLDAYRERGLSDLTLPSLGNPGRVIQALALLKRFTEQHEAKDAHRLDPLEGLGEIVNQTHDQIQLALLSGSRSAAARKWSDLLTSFPQRYVDATVRDLHFNPWRTACFSRTCTNASMWGTYGDSHKGAALVFRPEYDGSKRHLPLRGLNDQKRAQPFEFHPVDYRRDGPPPIDFFLSMGTLPMEKLRSTWFANASGQTSPRLKEIVEHEERWREHYWKQAMARATWKLRDWKHEQEERLVAMSVLADDPAPEPLKFEFSQLHGIVFGMRTSTDDKLEIAEIVEAKCRAENRQDFQFFQCSYSGAKRSLDVRELSLLSFDFNSE